MVANMRNWRLSLLLFSAVTIHGCLSDTVEPGTKDGSSIGDIIDFYNQKEGVTYLYKSLDQISIAPSQEEENPVIKSFIIKETMCLKSENVDLSQCDFKVDGDVKICSVDLGDEGPEDIMCISQTKDIRVKRSSRKPCSKKPCRPKLTGGYTLIGRPGKNQNGAQVVQV
ncbi:cathelin-related peptide SC5-like [Dendrobates tinctorius]|uniref:cathelin-related peptide SC5-like n=1 Tax=Dendrobates tinctorius TaxID=92724 RepID=UPI003CC97E63